MQPWTFFSNPTRASQKQIEALIRRINEKRGLKGVPHPWKEWDKGAFLYHGAYGRHGVDEVWESGRTGVKDVMRGSAREVQTWLEGVLEGLE